MKKNLYHTIPRSSSLQKNLPSILIIYNDPHSYFSSLKPYPSFHAHLYVCQVLEAADGFSGLNTEMSGAG